MNIRLVIVDFGPLEINNASATSSNETIKANSAPATTELWICGKVTVGKALSRDAPRLRATISWLILNCLNAAAAVTKTNGIASPECASTKLIVVFRFRLLLVRTRVVSPSFGTPTFLLITKTSRFY